MLTGTNTKGHSRPGSNDNEKVLHTLQSSKTGTSPPNPGHSFRRVFSASNPASIF